MYILYVISNYKDKLYLWFGDALLHKFLELCNLNFRTYHKTELYHYFCNSRNIFFPIDLRKWRLWDNVNENTELNSNLEDFPLRKLFQLYCNRAHDCMMKYLQYITDKVTEYSLRNYIKVCSLMLFRRDHTVCKAILIIYLVISSQFMKLWKDYQIYTHFIHVYVFTYFYPESVYYFIKPTTIHFGYEHLKPETQSMKY